MDTEYEKSNTNDDAGCERGAIQKLPQLVFAVSGDRKLIVANAWFRLWSNTCKLSLPIREFGGQACEGCRCY